MQQDPLADALTLIRNAERAGKPLCEIRPGSQLIGRVLKVLQHNGYIGNFEFLEYGRAGLFRVGLKGNINDCSVIKPRYAVARTDLERMEGRFLPAQDFGVLIMTTTKGVMAHGQAKTLGIGGRLLAYVY